MNSKLIILILLCSVAGCVFYRHDVESGRVSTTVWTLLKDFDVVVDPNSIRYNSTSQEIKAITPYGIVESESD